MSRKRALPITTAIADDFRHDQVTVGTTPVLICHLHPTRTSLLIRNIGSVDMYVGHQNVSIKSGFLVKAGETISLDHNTSDIWAIVGLGSTTVCYIEE